MSPPDDVTGRKIGRTSLDWAETVTEVDGRPVRSLSLGRRNDLPEVVLIPGMGAPPPLYPWVQRTARWTRATVLDLPGWRRGQLPSCASTVPAVGTAAARWLEVTDIRGVVLAGHSSGAQSAVHAALLVPDRLIGLVLTAPTLDPRARNPAVLLARILQGVVWEKPIELPAVWPWWGAAGLPWFQLVRSVVRDRPERLLGAVNPPLLVLSGEHDRLAPPAWARHVASLGSARYTTLPGPHNVCFASPEAVDAAVRAAVLGWTGQPSDVA